MINKFIEKKITSINKTICSNQSNIKNKSQQMKISTQTTSTNLYTPKIEGEFNLFRHYDRYSQQVIENPNDIDLSIFQKQMQRIQQKVILQQIQKYHHMNLQKLFPPLLKQLQQQSQKLITLENRLLTIKQQNANQSAKLQQVEQQMQQQKEQLEQSLFQLQSESRLKCQYEKQLILGNVQCLESRVKELMKQKEEINEEKLRIIKCKDKLINEIQEEKQIIMKLAIKKTEIQQEINFINTCQIEPIHMIREKSLQLYQAKVKHFQQRFINKQGLIDSYCQNFQSISQKEFGEILAGNQSKCINEGWTLQQRLIELKKRLNTISAAKIQITQHINIQHLRNSILSQQIDQKTSQIQKYQHLLTSVQNQQYCIETIIDNYSIEKQVVKDSQLQQKVNNQLSQNEILKKRLDQLVDKLNVQRQTNVKLNKLLSQVKIDHQMRTNKMIAENDILKSKLQTKKKIYQNKIQLHQPIVSVFTREKSFQNRNYQTAKTKTYKKQQESYHLSGFKPYQEEQKIQWKIKSANNEFQNINLINRRIQPSKQSSQKQQSLQSRMSELRGRLMRKFQQAQHMKK